MLSACLAFIVLASPPRVGDETPQGKVFVTTGQWAGGVQSRVRYGNRPVDMVATPDGKRLIVKDHRGLALFDAERGRLLSELRSPAGASLAGLSWWGASRLVFTDARNGVRVAKFVGDTLVWTTTTALPNAAVGGSAYPIGVAIDGATAWVCASRSNELHSVDLLQSAVQKRIKVEPAPYGVALLGKDRALVTCWGRTPVAGKPSAQASGTPVEIDARGVAAGGSVCLVDLERGTVVRKVFVQRQPGIPVVVGERVYVPMMGGTEVAAFDYAGRKVRAIPVAPRDEVEHGAAPSVVADAGDGRLFVALAGENVVARVTLSPEPRIEAVFDTDWYPSALAFTPNGLFVANVKGVGSRGATLDKRNVYQYTGSVGKVDLATLGEREKLVREKPAARNVQAVPVPSALGEPSVFKHVVLVIKENRTYDQVFGDMPIGDGDPALNVFKEESTPNHRALARQFVLLDNYYCNGVCSADGHAWTVEGNASSYLERSFGGWTRSYPFGGDDPLAPTGSGFVWDALLDAGLTFRNYGEFDYAEPSPKKSFVELLRAFEAGERPTFSQNISVKRLRDLSCPDYPGWNMGIPDVLRAGRFLEEFRKFEQDGKMPNLTIVYLPQDHTSGLTPGAPTPRAHMADNDLALGRVVEAISKSRFWPETCVFVLEDDPQDGFDHVDGHRSLCLVASPYTRTGKVHSDFANQSSVLRTILRMFGLPPMNRMQARAPLMSFAFAAEPDLRPYDALTPVVPLDELNKAASMLPPTLAALAETCAAQDFRGPDRVEDDLWNRALWFSAHPDRRYPADWAGAHGRGLGRRGLDLLVGEGDD